VFEKLQGRKMLCKEHIPQTLVLEAS